MQITHPQAPYNHIPPEDVFIASDDLGTQVGVGYLIYQYLPHRSPECPVNIYFDINSLPQGWYLLLGAIVARARILRERDGAAPARLYTRVDPQNTQMIEQYRNSGLSVDQCESLAQLFLPQGEGRVPMSCTIEPVPLNTRQEQENFLRRLRDNDITHIDINYLQYLQRLPHFHAMAMVQNGMLVGEVMIAGTGSTCELVAIYTAPLYRRQGMAKVLLQRCMAVMSSEGVNRFGGVFISMSEPQKHLARDFQAKDTKVQGVFPQLIL